MTDKHEKFVALAEKRVTRTIRELRLVGNLANRHNYSYTVDDAKAILAAIEAETKVLRVKFLSATSRTSSGFKLRGSK